MNGSPREVTTVAEAAVRMLEPQFERIHRNRAAALAGDVREPVHDLRVAINRVRAAEHLVRHSLAGTSARAVVRELTVLRRRLGASRDAEVWLTFLEGDDVAAPFRERWWWKAYVERQKQAVAAFGPVLAGALRGRGYAGLARRMTRLTENGISRSAAARETAFGPLAARQLDRALRRLIANAPAGRARKQADRIHAFRKLCRQVRYWAEFAEPELGKRVGKLARLMGRITGALGGVHDMDLRLAEAREGAFDPPRALLPSVRKRRKSCWKAFDAAWARVVRKEFLHRLQRDLKRAGSAGQQGTGLLCAE